MPLLHTRRTPSSPPRIRTRARGDAAWVRWWCSSILVHCQVSLSLPTMNDEVYHVPTGYLQTALIHRLDTTRTFLTNIHHNNDNYQLANTTLKPAPDGSHIITHPKKHNSTILTIFVISMEDEHAYAMIATLEGPICIQLRTLICIRGTTHS